MSRGQEKATLNSTLACLLRTLHNKRTTVELRNESFVTGKVTPIQISSSTISLISHLADCPV